MIDKQTTETRIQSAVTSLTNLTLHEGNDAKEARQKMKAQGFTGDEIRVAALVCGELLDRKAKELQQNVEAKPNMSDADASNAVPFCFDEAGYYMTKSPHVVMDEFWSAEMQREATKTLNHENKK